MQIDPLDKEYLPILRCCTVRSNLIIKPEGIFYAQEVAQKLGITLRQVQSLAKAMGVKKDRTHFYYFTQEDIDRIKTFVHK